jgi:hypothetical protein
MARREEVTLTTTHRTKCRRPSRTDGRGEDASGFVTVHRPQEMVVILTHKILQTAREITFSHPTPRR